MKTKGIKTIIIVVCLIIIGSCLLASVSTNNNTTDNITNTSSSSSSSKSSSTSTSAQKSSGRQEDQITSDGWDPKEHEVSREDLGEGNSRVTYDDGYHRVVDSDGNVLRYGY